MRPTNTSPTAASGFQRWNSPVPYIFGGLAVMLGFIALALIILVCSCCKSSANSSSDTVEKPAKAVNSPVDTEPKIVVIMAGDDIPTYLAKPVSSTLHGDQQMKGQDSGDKDIVGLPSFVFSTPLCECPVLPLPTVMESSQLSGGHREHPSRNGEGDHGMAPFKHNEDEDEDEDDNKCSSYKKAYNQVGKKRRKNAASTGKGTSAANSASSRVQGLPRSYKIGYDGGRVDGPMW
ncbi:hypothetical protein HHK36_029856 [Tetracentron sinense]|uniref:Uncharacterized protein n=1 Tax=Tetracentron sinense TaxID=13715 RepID=A0A834YBM4_TETSI|nr:hypothetical protein HHK36_029856 [Tetracentron sinense]